MDPRLDWTEREALMRALESGVTRRTVLAGAGAAAVTAFLAACGGGSNVSSGTLKKGGTLTVGQTFATQVLNPQPRSPANVSYRLALYNRLTNIGETGQIEPELASSWTISADNTSTTLKLQKGVLFHSGKELTADDVIWNIQWALDPKNNAQPRTLLAGVKVSAPDKYTLTMNFPQAVPGILYLVADLPLMEPNSNPNLKPVGTGPFKFQEFVPSDHITLVRNESYWRSGRPYLDKLVIKVVPDAASLVIALESKSVDIAVSPPVNDVARLKTSSTLAVEQRSGAGNYDIAINTQTKPFDDKRVRQAMSLAMDRKRFVDTILKGLSYATKDMFPKSSPAYDPADDKWEFSLDKAKQLLAAAGQSGGFDATLNTSRATFAPLADFAQIFQADLAKIGVRLQVRDLESAQYIQQLTAKTYPGMITHGYGTANLDPSLVFTTIWRPLDNSTHFQSPDYDKLIAQGSVEPDHTKRIAIYRQLAQYTQDQAFIIPVTNVPALWARSKKVHGFKQTTGEALIFDDVWVG